MTTEEVRQALLELIEVHGLNDPNITEAAVASYEPDDRTVSILLGRDGRWEVKVEVTLPNITDAADPVAGVRQVGK